MQSEDTATRLAMGHALSLQHSSGTRKLLPSPHASCEEVRRHHRAHHQRQRDGDIHPDVPPDCDGRSLAIGLGVVLDQVGAEERLVIPEDLGQLRGGKGGGEAHRNEAGG